MFREHERIDRARARERSLGRGSSTIRDLDRFLTKTCQQAIDTRRQVMIMEENARRQKSPLQGGEGRVSRPHIQMMKIGREGGGGGGRRTKKTMTGMNKT